MAQKNYPKDDFLDSIERCLASESFIPDFYTRFLAQSPSIRDRFARTDMTLQAQKLANMLRLLASAVAGESEALKQLSERAETHSRKHLNITPDMYELWSSSILATAREHDTVWTHEVEEAWNSTLEFVVNFMIARA